MSKNEMEDRSNIKSKFGIDVYIFDDKKTLIDNISKINNENAIIYMGKLAKTNCMVVLKRMNII
jgi:hypothetical protein